MFHLYPEEVSGKRSWDGLIKICFKKKIKGFLTVAQD